MRSKNTYVVVAALLQIAMVVGGHFSTAVIDLSAVLGMGIPLVVGLVFGARAATSTKDALGGGFWIGIVGAAIGILIAILLGDQPWMLLAFGPVSSGITGLLGGVIGYKLGGGK